MNACSKGNTSRGKLELRLDSPDGTLIGTFAPQNTGGWGDYTSVDIPLDLVDGIHDLVFVGTSANGLMDWKSFELSEKLLFRLSTDYKVNDQNGKDVQCTYDTVKASYIDQVFNRYYNGTSSSSAEEMFYNQFGATSEATAMQIVYELCGSAQDAMDQM